MTKKDFVVIADALRKSKSEMKTEQFGSVFNNILNALIREYPRFDYKKFTKYVDK